MRPSSLRRLDPDRVRALLSRYVPVSLSVAGDHLDPADRQLLQPLMEAASWIDRLYWRQVSDEDWQAAIALSQSAEPHEHALGRLLRLNAGSWDAIDDYRPIWGDRARPPGANFYPADLTREEFDAYLERNPHERQALSHRTTLVRREGERLAAVPYGREYRAELSGAARALLEASRRAGQPAMETFLKARARDLLGEDLDSLSESDALWVGMGESPIDIAIGPFDTYDDALLGLKASYEAAVLVRHPMTAKLPGHTLLSAELREELNAPVDDVRRDHGFTAAVYDLVYCSGALNVGAKAIATTLPTDEHVVEKVGSRLLLFRNVIAAKFQHILGPLAVRVLAPEQHELLREDAFLLQTLLHEAAHASSSLFVSGQGRQGRQTQREALRERYSTLEECRAELVGLLHVVLLARHGLLASDLTEPATVTFVAGCLRTLRHGLASDHARAAAMIISDLLESGGMIATPRGARIDVAKALKGLRRLAKDVQDVTRSGDYGRASRLVDALAVVEPQVGRLLQRTRDVPVDLEFIF